MIPGRNRKRAPSGPDSAGSAPVQSSVGPAGAHCWSSPWLRPRALIVLVLPLAGQHRGAPIDHWAEALAATFVFPR
jgi:hypothetical protein